MSSAFENTMLELSAIFVYEYLHVYFNMENRKKQGSLDSFFCSKPKQPKLQLNEEPDKVKETGIPVEAEEGSSNCGKQNTYHLSMTRLKMQYTALCAKIMADKFIHGWKFKFPKQFT